ncbi:glycoside hydrolase family 7 protein [Bipolaris oryzae ATCC 44560]|uniref:Glucanase n=1 Tax=Bipolaris oryzae ATCC 44560 TaxID=930090 RepID=W6ZCG9_COCMI|nr:glycoside hydrolase family 7 protein [Bipolaris oryzae ATCC 44560]EUC45124.1 glycoside hydrolase family 7 protein [Bipolaris oryzae ATCC 44560]
MAPLFFAATLLGLASAQTMGTTPEVHPKLSTWKCTKAGGCKMLDTSIVIDSLRHKVHPKSDPSATSSCGDRNNPLNLTVCPDKATCAQNCVIEGIQDYSTQAVFTDGGKLRLDMFNPSGEYMSPRVYLLGEDKVNYEMLQLNGQEFSFDVDMSKLPCGMNSALYLNEMKADGGRSKLNPTGANMGWGYCDAQCSVKPFLDGEANIDKEGACCNEMDIWEANSRANQIAPHVCAKEGVIKCTGDDCGVSGVCGKTGCGDNAYNFRNSKDFYGPGLKVDTTRPFTVVTQFPEKYGVLQAIIRKYVQDGVVTENAMSNVTMDQVWCSAQARAKEYNKFGGHKTMGDALARGMVLTFSLWWDKNGGMQWLDGGLNGPCSPAEDFPDIIQQKVKNPTVTFSEIKWGEIGSTFGTNQTLQ